MMASLIDLIKRTYLKYSQSVRFYSSLNRAVISLKKEIKPLIDNESLIDLNSLLSNVKLDFSFIDINHSCINNLKFIKIVYKNEITHNIDTACQVLSYQQKDNGVETLERDYPSDIRHLVSGNYQKMLMRYFFAGAVFCKNKKILDSCCGEGWGSFILSSYAETVTSFDQQINSINTEQWSRSNIKWVEGDALDTKLLINNHFDVVTAMETIEHFSRENGKLYIRNMHRLLKDNGIFIGTSVFPNNRDEAETSPSFTENPYHLYLWTIDEIKDELIKYFSIVKTVGNWMFIAQK